MQGARELVVKALYQMEEQGTYSNQALKEVLQNPALSEIDRGFATELLMGVVRNRLKLDYIIRRFSKIRMKKLSPWILQILRLGVYQLIAMEKVPVSAACNEAVKLAGRYGNNGSKGFVNGVLRSVAREKDKIEYPQDPIEGLSVVYSCPPWLTEKLVAQYGVDVCERILEASHRQYPVTVRGNATRITREGLLERLIGEGIQAELPQEDGCWLKITGPIRIQESLAYQEGLYTIQNRSSMRAVELLDPKPGECVLDLCAAPGGKTTYIAERMENKGAVYAFDIYPHKIRLIEKSAERLGLSIVTAKVQDGATFASQWAEKADRVLADVPCSGIGVIHKKPDIKWQRKPEDLIQLCRMQQKILQNAAGYVKQGGVLVYSTCTILQEENQDQIQAFLKKNSEFRLVEEEQIQTYATGGSGFYIAKLVRGGEKVAE